MKRVSLPLTYRKFENSWNYNGLVLYLFTIYSTLSSPNPGQWIKSTHEWEIWIFPFSTQIKDGFQPWHTTYIQILSTSHKTFKIRTTISKWKLWTSIKRFNYVALNSRTSIQSHYNVHCLHFHSNILDFIWIKTQQLRIHRIHRQFTNIPCTRQVLQFDKLPHQQILTPRYATIANVSVSNWFWWFWSNEGFELTIEYKWHVCFSNTDNVRWPCMNLYSILYWVPLCTGKSVFSLHKIWINFVLQITFESKSDCSELHNFFFNSYSFILLLSINSCLAFAWTLELRIFA